MNDSESKDESSAASPNGTVPIFLDEAQLGAEELLKMLQRSVDPVPKGTRVDVWNGTHTKYVGKGTYVGTASVWYYSNRRLGALMTPPNPEKYPPPQYRLYQWLIGGVLHKDDTIPKIRLDDGRFVYGCECWWSEKS